MDLTNCRALPAVVFLIVALAGVLPAADEARALDCKHYTDMDKLNCHMAATRIWVQQREAAKSPEQKRREAVIKARKDEEDRRYRDRMNRWREQNNRELAKECNKMGGVVCQILWQSYARPF